MCVRGAGPRCELSVHSGSSVTVIRKDRCKGLTVVNDGVTEELEALKLVPALGVVVETLRISMPCGTSAGKGK